MDRTANYLKFIAIGVISGLTTISCNDSFMKETTRNKTSGLAALSTTIDEAGNISATIDPNATTTQVLKFSTGNLAGSAIAIPPGALAIPVSITVGEGENLSSSEFLQTLGITNNTVTAAGPSVSFVPSSNVEASNPFTLSIPLSTTALALTSGNDNVVVMYRWMKVVNGEPTYSMGIIPGNEVVISSDKVSFQTTKFGVFQLAKSEAKITERVNVPTIQPPALKKDAGNPIIGKWGICSSESAGRGNRWESDPLEIERISGGNSSQINFSGPNMYYGATGVSLNWRGGSSPFKIERSDTSDFTSVTTMPLQYNYGQFQDLTPPSGRNTAYYRITDSNGSSGTIAAYIPNYIAVTNVQTTADKATITWSSNGSSFKILSWSNSNCSGTFTEYSPSGSTGEIPFQSFPMLALSIKDTNSGTTSPCVKVSRRSPIDILSYSFKSGSAPKLSLTWEGSSAYSPFLIEQFSENGCATPVGTAIEVAGNSITADVASFSGVTYFKVRSKNNSDVGSSCLPINAPASNAEINVTDIYVSNPGVNSTHGRVSLTWAPLAEKTQMAAKKYTNPSCSSATTTNPQEFSIPEGLSVFSDTNPSSPLSYYKIETKNEPKKYSECIAVNVSQSVMYENVPNHIVVTSVEQRSYDVVLNWTGGQAGYTETQLQFSIKGYTTSGCNGTVNTIASGLTANNFPFDPTTPSTVTSVRVEDGTGQQSECVNVSKLPTNELVVVSSASVGPTGVQINWAVPSETINTLTINKYGDNSCSVSPVQLPLDKTSTIFNDNPAAGNYSYKIGYTLTTGNPISSACIPVTVPAPTQRLTQAAGWRFVSASARSIALAWSGKFAGGLEKYEGSSCVGSGDAEVVYPTDSHKLISTYNNSKLKPSTNYSFKLIGNLNGTSTTLPCITVQTPAFDPFITPATFTQIAVPATIEVKSDQSHNISIRTSKLTQTWMTLSQANNGSKPLLIPYSTDLTNEPLALAAHPSCYFSVDGKYRSEIQLTNTNTTLKSETTNEFIVQLKKQGTPQELKIICRADDGSQSGGGSFGPSEDSPGFSKRMSLVISTGGFTMIEDMFFSPDCSSNRVSSRIELGSFLLPGPDSVADTYPVDVTPKELGGIFFTQQMVDFANKDPEQFACAVGGWVVNKNQNLTNTKCASTGKTDYLRLKVIPNKTIGDRLYMCDPPGEDSEYGKTAATRIPTCDITDNSFYFKRQ